jgi:hypothetical protein
MRSAKLSSDDLEKMRAALKECAHNFINERQYFGNRHYQAVKHATNVFEAIAREHGFKPSEARIDLQTGEIIG